MKNKILLFWLIVGLVIFSVAMIIIKPTKLGLDLVGGSRLVLEAQTTPTIAKITPEMMDSLQFAIENNGRGAVLTVITVFYAVEDNDATKTVTETTLFVT